MSALLLFIPVLGAPLLHAPVLTSDVLKPLKRPLDGGATFRGKRLFGDNKTWRGAAVMTLGPLLATLALWQWPWWRDTIPDAGHDAGPLLLGLLIGVGIVLGELPNSFLKRQLDVAPGTQATGGTRVLLTTLDQGDLVLGIWLCLLPVYGMPLHIVALAFVIVSAIHLLVNVIGYAIGARSAPI